MDMCFKLFTFVPGESKASGDNGAELILQLDSSPLPQNQLQDKKAATIYDGVWYGEFQLTPIAHSFFGAEQAVYPCHIRGWCA